MHYPPAQEKVITFQLNSFSSKKILMNELPWNLNREMEGGEGGLDS